LGMWVPKITPLTYCQNQFLENLYIRESSNLLKDKNSHSIFESSYLHFKK
jgi:hypothetical protein